MVVTNNTKFNTFINTLYESKEIVIEKNVDKHILLEGQEGDSNIVLESSIHYGIVGYLAIIEHELTTSELTIDELKDKFKFDELHNNLYKLGYNLNQIVEDLILAL